MKVTSNVKTVKYSFHLEAHYQDISSKNNPPQRQAQVRNDTQLSHVVTCAALKGKSNANKSFPQYFRLIMCLRCVVENRFGKCTTVNDKISRTMFEPCRSYIYIVI